MATLTADDRLAIQELLHRYAHCIDRGLWDEFATLFTADATLDFGSIMGVHQGREGIATFAGLLRGAGVFMRHYVTNILIAGDAERAHVDCYVLAMTGAPGNVVPTTGFYEDEVVKVDGRWLMRSRRATIER